MRALADESSVPKVPVTVPSGRPVITHSGRSAPVAPEPTAVTLANRGAMTLTVGPGESIQAAVDAARPGDTIAVLPGVYSETVRFDVDAVTLRGVTVGGERPPLDGRGEWSDGIIG